MRGECSQGRASKQRRLDIFPVGSRLISLPSIRRCKVKGHLPHRRALVTFALPPLEAFAAPADPHDLISASNGTR